MCRYWNQIGIWIPALVFIRYGLWGFYLRLFSSISCFTKKNYKSVSLSLWGFSNIWYTYATWYYHWDRVSTPWNKLLKENENKGSNLLGEEKERDKKYFLKNAHWTLFKNFRDNRISKHVSFGANKVSNACVKRP